MKKIISVILCITILSGCSVFNSRFLPKGESVVSATLTDTSKDTDINPDNSVFRPILYLEKDDASRLFYILKNSLFSLEKAPSDIAVKYKISFYDKNKGKLTTVDMKGESTVALYTPEGNKIGEYEVSNEFIAEINVLIKRHSL